MREKDLNYSINDFKTRLKWWNLKKENKKEIEKNQKKRLNKGREIEDNL